MLLKHELFGTDLGDVVIDRPRIKGVLIAQPTTEQFVESPPIKGAFEVIPRIIDRITPERFFVISKVKSDIETRLWLDYHNFYGKTGFLPENLRFCRERNAKGPISDKLPGGPLTYFVDDRADVLAYMPYVRHRFLFGPQHQLWLVRTAPFTTARTWYSIQDHLARAS